MKDTEHVEAALREERLNSEILRERLAEAEKNRDGAEMRGFRGFTFGQLADARDAAESRATAAEERVRELEMALEPLADMQLFSEHYAIGAITADQVRAARRALGRPE